MIKSDEYEELSIMNNGRTALIQKWSLYKYSAPALLFSVNDAH